MFGRRYKLRSAKYIREKRKLFLITSGIRFVTIFLFIVLFALVSHLDQFYIKNIKVSGNNVINKNDITDVVKNELEGKYFKIFLKNNSIIFPRKSIIRTLGTKYKRIKDIDVSFNGLHSIFVEIRERTPAGVWCDVVNVESIKEDKCYFLDNNGYVFSVAPRFSGGLFFRYYGGNLNGKILGSSYLPEEKFKEITFFLQSFQNIGLHPISYEWDKNGDSKVVVKPKEGTKIDSTILFNNNDDLGRIFENLNIVLEDKTFSGEDVISLEYIDLRFGNKVYFK